MSTNPMRDAEIIRADLDGMTAALHMWDETSDSRRLTLILEAAVEQLQRGDRELVRDLLGDALEAIDGMLR